METVPLSCCGLKLILFLEHLAVVVVVVLWLNDDVSTEAVFSTDRASVPAPDEEEDDVGVGALLFVVRLVTGGDGTTNPPFLVPTSHEVDVIGAQSVRAKSSERRPIPTPLRSVKPALMLLFALDDEEDTIAVVVTPAVLTVEFIVVVSVVAEVLLVVVMVAKDGIAAGSGGGGGTTLVLDGTGFLLFTMLLWWKNS